MFRRPDQLGPASAPGASMRGGSLIARQGAFAWLGAWGCALLAATITLAWALGAVVGDRFWFTQHASWIPAGLAALLALGLTAVSYGLGRLSRFAFGFAPAAVVARRRRAVAGQLPRRVALVIAIFAAAVSVVEWRLYRVVLPPPVPVNQTATPTTRVLFINAASEDLSSALIRIEREAPDVVLVSNPRFGSGAAAFRRGLLEAVGIAPDDTPGRLRSLGRLLVVSRYPITDAATTALDLGVPIEPAPNAGPRRTDPGRASFITLALPLAPPAPPAAPAPDASPDHDTTEPAAAADMAADADAVPAPTAEPATQPLTIWIIDLPRDPWRHRVPMAKTARQAIDTWQHPASRRATRTDASGRSVTVLGERPDRHSAPTVHDGSDEASALGFPAPALIVGDFNTPRGAGAIRTLVGADMKSAHAVSGVGAGLTFPRETPWLAIDLAFTAPGWRAASHAVVDLGAGTHRAVVVDLMPE